MRSALRSIHRPLPVVAGGLFAALFFAGIASAQDDRFTLDLRVGREAERFQSHEADSLGLSFSTCTTGAVECGFRVLDLPLGKTTRPTLVVSGHALTTERVFVPGGGAGLSGLPRRSPMFALGGGAGLTIPLGLVDGTRGADFLLRYEGGVVIAEDSGTNFLQSSSIHFGFARTGGVFDGSEMEVGFGHDDLFGAQWAAKRWTARLMLLAGLGRAPGTAKAPPVAGTAARGAAPPRAALDGRRPLRGFLETVLRTDGRPGPDAIGLRMGLAFDAGSLLALAGGGGLGR